MPLRITLPYHERLTRRNCQAMQSPLFHFLGGASWTSGHAVVSGATKSYQAMCANSVRLISAFAPVALLLPLREQPLQRKGTFAQGVMLVGLPHAPNQGVVALCQASTSKKTCIVIACYCCAFTHRVAIDTSAGCMQFCAVCGRVCLSSSKMTLEPNLEPNDHCRRRICKNTL